jgi:glycosyltransferase involved in cell wall biosynthesis
METARHLSGLGVKVDIRLTDDTIDYARYDLLHFFNIIRPADILFHCKRSRKPYVVSTILIDYSRYDKYQRKGFAGLLFRFLSADTIEYVKVIARWILGKDRLMSRSYLWKGQYRSVCDVLRNAALLLPNSALEYERIVERYKVITPYRVIPNGIDDHLFLPDISIEKDPLLVICAARIEGIKNQLNLIKALNGTKYTLLLIGSPAPNQLEYEKTCRKIADKNIHFIGRVSQKELLGYYNKAKVHILPSWFETTGLSSLEAAAMGCNVVISWNGDAKEYFGSAAFYCDPASQESILAAVQQASQASMDSSLQKRVLEKYTWQLAADSTRSAYKKILAIS